MADKKMGRPTDNPKPNKITIRMDNDTLEKLDKYCKNNNIERSEGVRRAIHKLDDKKINGSGALSTKNHATSHLQSPKRQTA
ncbi:ribbon-helix-helix domain-containing protein [Paenibacillus macerans]|uniref:ribbon-helix-helix domain-containing protein n=1 Tax=Paenibacillus macerans TaxID=44252 RepID=UPI002E1DB9F4|nr:ribbon-helix-helix domain-containing protein [Paenibacillus macerans]